MYQLVSVTLREKYAQNQLTWIAVQSGEIPSSSSREYNGSCF